MGVAFNDTNPTENKGGYNYRSDAESQMVDIEYVEHSKSTRLCWMNDAKWWKYTFKCTEEGVYDFSICITGQDGATGRVMAIIDGTDEYGTDDTPLTGWDNNIILTTLSPVSLSEGQHVLEIRPRGAINLDWYKFEKKSDDQSGISSETIQRPIIASGQGNILVLNYEGDVKVYSIAGTLLHSGANNGPIFLSRGIYVVQLDNSYSKVLVK